MVDFFKDLFGMFQTLIGTVGTLASFQWAPPPHRVFQTLIGTVGTGIKGPAPGGPHGHVSNPYRYGRNIQQRTTILMPFLVSNPYRYGRNQNGPGAVVSVPPVSNPYRYGRNEATAPAPRPKINVSNPYRYGRNTAGGACILTLLSSSFKPL